MKIGIVGHGVVGSATARTYVENHDVRIYDKDPLRSTHPFEEVVESEIVFLCLPTPQKEGENTCDLSAYFDFFKKLYDLVWSNPYSDQRKLEFISNTLLVIRSTVPIGTTEKLKQIYNFPNIVHSPEFLTARCAFVDALTPTRNIIGGSWDTPECSERVEPLRELYQRRFPGVSVLFVYSKESEAIKLMLNSFFATKVAFFNEMYQLCEQMNLNWDNVREGILGDGRIAHSHTMVPGPDEFFGFGGTCLPKDLANLITHFKETPPVCTAVQQRNEKDRKRSIL